MRRSSTGARACLLGAASLLGSGAARAELGPSQAVFTSISGTCGVVDASTVSVVALFACEPGAAGIDVTSDGTRAVIGSSFTDTLILVDLTPLPEPPRLGPTLASGVSDLEELDIARNDTFGIATGSGDGRVSRFTLSPFAVTGTLDAYAAVGSPSSIQDVHLDASGTVAVHPFHGHRLLQIANVVGSEPIDGPIVTTTRSHQGVSLDEADNDTILATHAFPESLGLTVASLRRRIQTAILHTSSATEAVDIKCDGTRAVVEAWTGLFWIDMTTTPPSRSSVAFGTARFDGGSTSSLAFSRDGSLLFAGGRDFIDVYDASTDPPRLLPGSPIFAPSYNVATLPCMATIEPLVDVQPGADLATLLPGGPGKITVAVLATEDFDPLALDLGSLCFGATPPDPMRSDCTEAHGRSHAGRDVDGDGVFDVILHFETAESGISFGDTEACLAGWTTDGLFFRVCDPIRTARSRCGLGVELALLLPPLVCLRRRGASSS